MLAVQTVNTSRGRRGQSQRGAASMLMTIDCAIPQCSLATGGCVGMANSEKRNLTVMEKIHSVLSLACYSLRTRPTQNGFEHNRCLSEGIIPLNENHRKQVRTASYNKASVCYTLDMCRFFVIVSRGSWRLLKTLPSPSVDIPVRTYPKHPVSCVSICFRWHICSLRFSSAPNIVVVNRSIASRGSCGAPRHSPRAICSVDQNSSALPIFKYLAWWSPTGDQIGIVMTLPRFHYLVDMSSTPPEQKGSKKSENDYFHSESPHKKMAHS